jgi:hypothetical protein
MKTIHWLAMVDGKAVGEDVERIDVLCPMCGALAITRLPSWEQAKQDDETNAVCNPALDGCNHGFAMGAE